MNITGLGIPGVVFKNWAKTFTCSPELYFAPKTPNELRQILAFANNDSKRVRVVGSGHSPSDLACCNDYLISLQHFDQVNVDTMNCSVKVGGGVKVSTLNEKLPEYNLNLSMTGSVSDITIAGAISTGTHGSGSNLGHMGTFVTELEIMAASGEVKTCSRTEDQDLFLATICGLGAIGIIISITYQCEPKFNLLRSDFPAGLKDVIEHLDVHSKSSEYFHFHWYPHTENVVVIHASKTTLPATKYSILEKISNWFWNYAIGYYALEFGYWLGTMIPGFTPVVNRIMYRLLYSKPKKYVDESFKVLAMECRFKQYVTEWAIDRSKTGSTLMTLKEWLEANPEVYAHIAVEVRFVKSDDIFLSPCYGRETCFINIVMYRPYNVPIPYEKYWAAYESIMMDAGGRPHWAKAHKLRNPDFERLYPQWTKWCEIREKLDPTNMFINSYMERILTSY